MMVFLATGFVILVFLWVANHYDDRFYWKVGLLALIAHLFVAITVIPLLPYQWDFGQFHQAGQAVATGEFPRGDSVAAFATIHGAIYVVFGSDPTNVAIINALLAVLLPIPINTIVERLYGRLPQRGLTMIVLFLPLPSLFMTLPMRDAASVFLTFVLLAIVVLAIGVRPLLGLFGVPLWGMLYLLRPELGLVLALAVAVGILIYLIRMMSMGLSFPSIVYLFAAAGILGFVMFSQLFSIDRVNAMRRFRAQGGAVYLEGVGYESWLDLILAAPGRGAYFLFAPFPLHVETVFHLIGLFATIYIIVFAIAAVRSVLESEVDEILAVTLGVFLIAGIVGYGLINSNFGTNARHRMPFVFVLVVFATPVIARWELSIRERLHIRPHEQGDDREEHSEAHEFDRDVHAR